MNKKEIEHLLNVAIEEINYSFNPYKDKTTKEVYLTNAIRFIKNAIDEINREYYIGLDLEKGRDLT